MDLDNKRAKSILDRLEELRADPFRPRPGMNIDKVEGDRKPPAYRLRVGRLRIEYLVVDEENKTVFFNEGFDLVSVDKVLNSCVNIFNLYSRFLAYFTSELDH